MDEARIKDIALADLENILRENGRSLKDFPPMPLPSSQHVGNTSNLLLLEELSYNTDALKDQLNELSAKLTNEQGRIFNHIMDACYKGPSGIFFVNGFGGTGKTFIWNVLTTAIRSKGDIVLAGISSLNFIYDYR